MSSETVTKTVFLRLKDEVESITNVTEGPVKDAVDKLNNMLKSAKGYIHHSYVSPLSFRSKLTQQGTTS
jgi:hypothetical protein